jgi:beta-lactamase superfamily II metal-dependent hydrolase
MHVRRDPDGVLPSYSPNNISCVVKYGLQDGATMLWMGDLETDFMESVKDEVTMPAVDVLFAPHHGRVVVPKQWLEEMDPEVVVIGEAPSEHLNYYPGYNTITQNTAGDITFDCALGETQIYVSNQSYSVDFLTNQYKANRYGKYIGTLS